MSFFYTSFYIYKKKNIFFYVHRYVQREIKDWMEECEYQQTRFCALICELYLCLFNLRFKDFKSIEIFMDNSLHEEGFYA